MKLGFHAQEIFIIIFSVIPCILAVWIAALVRGTREGRAAKIAFCAAILWLGTTAAYSYLIDSAISPFALGDYIVSAETTRFLSNVAALNLALIATKFISLTTFLSSLVVLLRTPARTVTIQREHQEGIEPADPSKR